MENCERFGLDFVFCIDSSLSMDSYKEQLRDVVKNTFEEACNAISKNLPASLEANARLKIIAFFDADLASKMPYISYWMEKDYDDDILEHELDTLDFLIDAEGVAGRLEALELALRSDFFKIKGDSHKRDIQIIVLLTNNDGCHKEDNREEVLRPLLQLWESAEEDPTLSISPNTTKLFLFAPIDTVYERLAEEMNGVYFESLDAGDRPFDFVVGSISDLVRNYVID